VGETLAHALILKFLWNQEQLFNKYWEYEDCPKSLFNLDLAAVKKMVPPKKPYLCPVCYEESLDTLGMQECGHYLCLSCYGDYIKS
jgi:hypothetical protein